jgi:hypothetical protein
MAKLGFKVQVTEEDTEQRPQYEDLPNGVYVIEAHSADVVRENEGTPQQKTTVKIVNEVVEPEEFKGRKLWVNYFTEHPSDKAQEIGYRKFQCLLRAVGIGEVNEDSDTDEILFKSYVVTIGMSKPSKEKNPDGSPVYPPRNEIKTYWYPDQDNAPDIGVTGPAPTKAANDNAPPRDARTTGNGGTAKSRPWGNNKAA